MFMDSEDPFDMCANCVPISPLELEERLRSKEVVDAMEEFFNGPAQEMLAQMQTALARLKAEQAEKLKSEIS